jgi:hypothetical protein
VDVESAELPDVARVAGVDAESAEPPDAGAVETSDAEPPGVRDEDVDAAPGTDGSASGPGPAAPAPWTVSTPTGERVAFSSDPLRPFCCSLDMVASLSPRPRSCQRP